MCRSASAVSYCVTATGRSVLVINMVPPLKNVSVCLLYYMCNSVELHYPPVTTGRLGYCHRCVGCQHVVCAWPVADDHMPWRCFKLKYRCITSVRCEKSAR